MYENFEKLLEERGISAYKVAKDTGIGTATLSNWKTGKYTPKQDKLQKIADYFGVTLECLMGVGGNPSSPPNLNRRDHRDIEKVLDDAREQLLTSEGLMFDGRPATDEDIQQILDAMQIGLEMAKKKNKDKYTPKKYRK